MSDFRIELYSDALGREPFSRWAESLSDAKAAYLLGAVSGVLAVHGIDVCATPYGKQLGRGLAELRVRGEAGGESILLRVFFHAFGRKRILLLSGYDKGVDPSTTRQRREIESAHRMLREFRTR